MQGEPPVGGVIRYCSHSGVVKTHSHSRDEDQTIVRVYKHTKKFADMFRGVSELMTSVFNGHETDNSL
jgi:hypothetical protein